MVHDLHAEEQRSPAQSARLWLSLARSGALDEISNAADAVKEFIGGRGLVQEGSTMTNRAIVFVIYQTGSLGPQNGFRFCLVHEGFDLELGAEDILRANQAIGYGAMEFIELGQDVMGQWS